MRARAASVMRACPPVRLAQPIAALSLTKSNGHIDHLAGLQSNATDGLAAVAQANSTAFRNGKNGTNDLASFLHTLV